MRHRAARARGEGEALRPEAVVAEGAPALRLAPVDVGVRGRVHDQLGRERRRASLHHGVVVADVEHRRA